MKSRVVRDDAPDPGEAAGAINRRALLTGAGLTGAGLTATALAGAALVTPAQAFNASPAENAPRYKESEHVKTFYRLVGR